MDLNAMESAYILGLADEIAEEGVLKIIENRIKKEKDEITGAIKTDIKNFKKFFTDDDNSEVDNVISFPIGFEKKLEIALKKALSRIIKDSKIKKEFKAKIDKLNRYNKENGFDNYIYKAGDINKLRIRFFEKDSYSITFDMGVEQNFNEIVLPVISNELSKAPEVITLFKSIPGLGFDVSYGDGDEGIIIFYSEKATTESMNCELEIVEEGFKEWFFDAYYKSQIKDEPVENTLTNDISLNEFKIKYGK